MDVILVHTYSEYRLQGSLVVIISDNGCQLIDVSLWGGEFQNVCNVGVHVASTVKQVS